MADIEARTTATWKPMYLRVLRGDPSAYTKCCSRRSRRWRLLELSRLQFQGRHTLAEPFRFQWL
jgi:hypothetical protein